MIAVVQDGLGFARADHRLDQRGAHRVAGLDAVDLIVAIEIEGLSRVRRVIGKPHAVGWQESSGANLKAFIGLIRNPVLVGDERAVRQRATVAHGRMRRLAADRAVRSPPVFLHGPTEIEIHQEIQVLMATGKADPQLGRTQLEPELDRPKGVAEGAIQECLLPVGIVRRPRSGSLSGGAGRRQLPVRKEPPVRGQQPAAGGRVMTGRASCVLLREKGGLGPCRGCENRDGEQVRQRSHDRADRPRAKTTSTWTVSLTPMPR